MSWNDADKFVWVGINAENSKKSRFLEDNKISLIYLGKFNLSKLLKNHLRTGCNDAWVFFE